MSDDYATDVDGKRVHPAVADMAAHLADQALVHDVQINWWEEGRIQIWCRKRYVPSDVFDEIERADWTPRHAETRALDGTDRGYAEIRPTAFDPSEFAGAGTAPTDDSDDSEQEAEQ